MRGRKLEPAEVKKAKDYPDRSPIITAKSIEAVGKKALDWLKSASTTRPVECRSLMLWKSPPSGVPNSWGIDYSG